MELDINRCYQALQARDRRFDGVFFVGVRTTGIYCRPVCTARIPRRENCLFMRSSAAAERAGYRPCLRCRPELAPGQAPVDTVGTLAVRAFSRIEEGVLSEGRVADLADELGVSERHLRRAVEQMFGVSPIALAQTQRLLAAKRLLTDTALSVTDIAFTSGFSSLRRLQGLFQERYHLSPTALRRNHNRKEEALTLEFELAYRPPFDWESLVEFLAGRASNSVEAREGDTYLRTVRVGESSGWIGVTPVPDRFALRLEVSASLAPVLPVVLARTRRLFDLDADPQAISAHLGTLALACPGLRVPGAFDGFEVAVRAILGQQVSVKAATTLAGRLARAFGEPIATPYPALTHLFPTAQRIAEADIAALAVLGIVTARAAAIQTLAQEVETGRLRLEPALNAESVITHLNTLPGIGEWTAQYIAMRTLGWPDAFPHTDLGIKKALNETSSPRLLECAEPWRPWRSYAAMHLWKSLESPRMEVNVEGGGEPC